jgi:hypothetical protein
MVQTQIDNLIKSALTRQHIHYESDRQFIISLLSGIPYSATDRLYQVYRDYIQNPCARPTSMCNECGHSAAEYVLVLGQYLGKYTGPWVNETKAQ